MKPIEKPNLSWQDDVNKTVHELIDAVNELMPQEFDCEQGRHDKCFAPTTFSTYPAKRNWICRLCGEVGTDIDTSYHDPYEYNKLVEKFKTKEE